MRFSVQNLRLILAFFTFQKRKMPKAGILEILHSCYILPLNPKGKGDCNNLIHFSSVSCLLIFFNLDDEFGSSKKTLRFLEISTLRVGSTHLVWRNLDTSRQVERSIFHVRMLTGTCNLESSKHTCTKKVIGTRCLHCLLEDVDFRHLVCRCPAFYEYGHTAARQLQETITHKSDYSV